MGTSTEPFVNDPSTRAPATRLIRVSDGRYVCVVEAGDPHGVPVFYFHGAPGSRIGGLAFDEVARTAGVRLIIPDRPGMGFSDPLPGRSVADWAGDVVDVADALDLPRFGVFGASGGGPYALACAALIAGRVTKVVAAMCPGPVADVPEMLDGYNGAARFLLKRAGRRPFLMRAAVGLMTRPSKDAGKNKFTEVTTGQLPTTDLEVQAWLEAMPALQSEPDEVRRQGLAFAAQDLVCIASPWGFDLSTIRPGSVSLWHGKDDGAVPVSTARLLGERIAGCELHIVEGGHYIAFSCADKIFAQLVAADSGTPERDMA